MKSYEGVRGGTMKKWLDFGGNLGLLRWVNDKKTFHIYLLLSSMICQTCHVIIFQIIDSGKNDYEITDKVKEALLIKFKKPQKVGCQPGDCIWSF